MNYKYFLLLFLFSSVFASPLDDEHEAITLGSGPQSFAADYYFEKTGIPQGGIILTHSGNHHHIAENLGYILSKYGWSVLVFQESPEEDSDSIALALATQYMESERGLFNLVLLSSGPAWKNVSHFLQQNQGEIKSIRGLVLLNTQKVTDMKELDPSLAILDIVTSRSTTIAFQNRKIYADRYKLERYQQMKLHLPSYYTAYGEDKLTRRIRGWLFHNVRGMEIEKNS